MASAQVSGSLTDGTKSVRFNSNASCDGVPSGVIAGTFENIFTGGPVLEDFIFTSTAPLLVGINEALNIVHVVFENVVVTNENTQQTFTGGTAILTAVGLTETSWEGSITVVFDTHTLTFFGLFTGVFLQSGTGICQQPL